jgi:uncharacterized protein (DUF305 family)
VALNIRHKSPPICRDWPLREEIPMRRFLIPTAVALLLAAPVAALAQGDHAGHGSPAAMPQDAASKAFMASHQEMMKGMDIAPTGKPDRDFARMMIPHHRGAIDMARVELEHGKDPAMRALAEQIIKDQEGEIAILEKWLEMNP